MFENAQGAPKCRRCTICQHPQRPNIDLGDAKAATAISGRLHESLSLTAKLTGELVPHAGVSITNVRLSPNFRRLRAELLRVLARYPRGAR